MYKILAEIPEGARVQSLVGIIFLGFVDLQVNGGVGP